MPVPLCIVPSIWIVVVSQAAEIIVWGGYKWLHLYRFVRGHTKLNIYSIETDCVEG